MAIKTFYTIIESANGHKGNQRNLDDLNDEISTFEKDHIILSKQFLQNGAGTQSFSRFCLTCVIEYTEKSVS